MLVVSLGLLALVTWIFMHNILLHELHTAVSTLNHGKQQQALAYLNSQVSSAQLISNREVLRTALGFPLAQALNSSQYETSFTALQNAMVGSSDIVAINVHYPDWTRLIRMNITQYKYDFQRHSNLYHAPDGSSIAFYYNGTALFLQVTVEINTINATSDTKTLLGYLSTVVLSKRLTFLANDPTNLGKTGEVYIVSNTTRAPNSFRLLVPPRLHQSMNVSITYPYPTFPAVKLALNGNRGVYVGKDFRGKVVTAAYSPIGIAELVICTVQLSSELEEPIGTLRSIILGVFFGMFGLAILVAYVFARAFTRPIRNLRTAANKLSHGDLGARVKDKSGRYMFADEMAELGVAFNTMANEISHQYGTLEQKVRERTAELEEAKKQADAANLAKGYFLANMSHEIRTPLNGIVGITDICIDNCNDVEQMKLLHTLKTSADHLLHLVNDILDYSKIDADKVELVIHQFSLTEVVEQVRFMFSIAAAKKNMELVCTIDDNVPTLLMGDASRLLQILINLFGNAIKFTMKGSIKLHVCLASKQPLTEEGADAVNSNVVELEFSVSDTGIGIAQEDQAKLFEAFSQVESTYNRRFGGTGLGLAICRKLVDLMNGRIWVESEVNQGTTFCFTAVFETDNSLKKKRSSDFENVQMQPLTILIAEDNSVNQLVITRTLQKLKHTAKVVSNGHLAVRECLNPSMHYDVVLMDIQMPEMDGIEATKLIRQSIPSEQLPIVALTAHVTTSDMEKCTAAGMNYFITKPVDIKKLSPILEEIFIKKSQ